MQDAARPNIINNTIANNDSTATAGLAFEEPVPVPPTGQYQSTPQPAGVVSRAHSTTLATLIDSLVAGGADPTDPFYMGFSNPQLVNNIIWHNRSFNFDINLTANTGVIVPAIEPWVYDDLAVVPAVTGALNPLYCLLTDTTGFDPSNITIVPPGTPAFESEYFNGPLGVVFGMPEGTTAFDVAAALDEGGNFIDVRFSPLTRYNDPTPGDGDPGPLFGDYHITGGSAALGAGAPISFTPALDALLNFDIDDDDRPTGADVDIGADEFVADAGQLNTCPGDFDTDGDVDGGDLSTFAADFGRTDCVAGPSCPGDFDTDGDVDGGDLAIFGADFGRTDCL
jgi:hypothetical protein